MLFITLMLPNCILASSKTGGKKGCHRISINTLRQEWSRGNEKSIWTASVSKSHQSTPISLASITKAFDHVQSDHAKLKSAIACAREGLLFKAYQILTSKRIAPGTKETLNDLKPNIPFLIHLLSQLETLTPNLYNFKLISISWQYYGHSRKQQLVDHLV